MSTYTLAETETFRQQLHDAERDAGTSENRGLSEDALRLVWSRGNKRRPPRPRQSPGYKINKVRLE